jgi:formylmethanofuran dehydrogenase subunit A
VTAIRISGGLVHDPANDVDGEVRDVCLKDGKVVADVGPEARRIDARGMVVMPGGVDIHAHIAGPKVNAARRLTPDDRRDDSLDRTELLRRGTGTHCSATPRSSRRPPRRWPRAMCCPSSATRR